MASRAAQASLAAEGAIINSAKTLVSTAKVNKTAKIFP
jgi:hypothetical protein